MTDNWTTSALKDYFDSHFDAVRAEVSLRVAELHREHDKFEETVRDGFVKQNEFRGSLEDLGRTMATRRELETLDRALGDRISGAERWRAKIGGALVIVGLIFPTAMAAIFYLFTHH